MKKSKYNKNEIKLYEEIIEDATADCHDEEEMYSGWNVILEDGLKFPIKCKILGDELDLINIDQSENAILGVIQKGKNKIRIPMEDIELINADKESTKLLNAYKYWIS